jgi:hypothetical protein
MPRANRYFLPGFLWHITYRCHKKEFLLTFSRDRECWLGWLFEANRRYEKALAYRQLTRASRTKPLWVMRNL